MLKMFSTQLSGLLKRIQEKEEYSIEDAARLLSQAAVGDGNIYIYGEKEMQAVASEAVFGAEPLRQAKQWQGLEPLSEADRVLIVSRYSNDAETLEIARQLTGKNISFVGISTIASSEGEDLSGLADVHIDLRLTKGLVPDEDGNRIGYPASIAALFVYHGLKFTIDEILMEYED